jgi:hypothetical protein
MKNTTDICSVVVYAVLLFAYSSVDVFEAEQEKYCLVFWDAEFTEGVGFQAILSIDPSSLNARSSTKELASKLFETGYKTTP